MIDLKASPTVYRTLNGSIEHFAEAQAFHLRTADGRWLLDLSGGPGVSCLGHNNLAVKQAMIEQVIAMPYAFASVFGTDASEALGLQLKIAFETWPGWFGKALFVCGGGEAVDLACKLAVQYWAERKQRRTIFAARKYAFHGIGMFTSGLSDTFGRFKMMNFLHQVAAAEFTVRLPGYLGYEEEDDEAVRLKTEEVLSKFKGSLAATIVEPLGGPPVGMGTPSMGHLWGLRELCDLHDTLLIFDEVFSGAGRTGHFTAAQMYDVQPDILILGKGITGGYAPLSAIVLSNRVVSEIEQGSGLISVGTTYTAHTVSCAAGAAALRYMRDQGLVALVKTRNNELQLILQQELTSICPVVYRVRGVGFALGVELRHPGGECFEPEVQFHARVRKRAQELGVIVYSKGQTVEGARDYITVTPPYEMPHRDIRKGVQVLRQAIEECYREYVGS